MKQVLMLPVIFIGLIILLLGMLLDYIGSFIVELAYKSDDDLGHSGHVYIANPNGRNFDL